MDSPPNHQTSRRLSWLLRHGALESGLAMDAAGWAAVEDVLALLNLTAEQLQAAVRDNTKARLQWEGGRIRACQGHSPQGTPVTAQALEASWAPFQGTGPLWHGTTLEVLPAVAREGLRPMARTHVHLASHALSTVGKRASVDVLLRVDLARLTGAGLQVYESPNGVLLTRAVPAHAITGLAAVSRAARRRHAELARVLGVPGADP